MSPKKRRTEGGQSCPLDREEPEGDKRQELLLCKIFVDLKVRFFRGI